MAQRIRGIAGNPLLAQLEWFIRLRWVASAVVILGSLADARYFDWYPYPYRTLIVGLVILAYNAILSVALRREQREKSLLGLAWVQLILDLACLTVMAIWTGGIDSPLRGFFVFHMVFASLLLPRTTAYAGALIAIFMFALALRLTQTWPVSYNTRLSLLGWIIMLLMTVYLTNRITLSLRRQRRRLIRQNKDIRRMSRQLRRHQTALVQHEKMIAMGQMAAGITHEVANPLANMDSLLQLMSRKPDKIRPEAIAQLREQIGRMSQIIAQMKSFAHPVEMQRVRVPLNETVAKAVEMLSFDRRVAKVKVTTQLDSNIGEFPFMPQALQQVLVNLLINALDAMAASENPTLLVRTERKDNWALIDVTDNGHGIRPEHMVRLSEPFFTTKPVGKGTGLGLSISYTLVQQQGGNISAKSNPGKGATFTVRLPMNPGAEPPVDSPTRERPEPVVAPPEKTGL